MNGTEIVVWRRWDGSMFWLAVCRYLGAIDNRLSLDPLLNSPD